MDVDVVGHAVDSFVGWTQHDALIGVGMPAFGGAVQQ